MNPDLLAVVFIPVFDLDADLVGHVHRGEDEEGVQLSPQRVSLYIGDRYVSQHKLNLRDPVEG